MIEIVFWILFAIVAYTYLGYAIVVFLIVQIKKLFKPHKSFLKYSPEELPEVCLFVTAYNEIEYVDQKVENALKLNYPQEKIQHLWITDGSDDGTTEKLKTYPQLEVYHNKERKGKMHAMNRGMQFVKAPIIIFSDSNTILGEDSILEIVNEFRDEKIGCISGEKRVQEKASDNAAAAGESLYWKLESYIKKLDSELYSAVGAAGELFAVRKELFEQVEEDTLLDDFMISMRIVQKAYKISYLPEAYAIESASLNVKEELKRKIRIAAGGVQSFLRLLPLLNPFKYGIFSFQYFSHKVLRWTLAPLSLFVILIVNFLIVLQENTFTSLNFYSFFLYLQAFMYLVALLGLWFENHKTSWKLLFIPYYFTAINIAALAGWIRLAKGKQSVKWEKAKRA